LIHATSQGELDPALAQSLGREILREIDRLKAASAPGEHDAALLDDAISRFDDTVLQARCSLLTEARQRLSDDAGGSAQAVDPGPGADRRLPT
jgi:hypothetical protein